MADALDGIKPHPEHAAIRADAEYWRLTFEGGDAYKAGKDAQGDDVLPRHKHELNNEEEYKSRRSGTPVNELAAEFTRQRADAVMGAKISRPALDDEGQADEGFTEFMRDVDGLGSDMTEFISGNLQRALVEGAIWLGLDAGAVEGVETKADEEAHPDARYFATWASPVDVVDWALDGEQATRIAIEYRETTKADITSEAVERMYWRQWTPEHHEELSKALDAQGKETGKIQRGEEIAHAFGHVPWTRREPLPGESYVKRFAPRQKAILETRSFIYAEQVASAFTMPIFFGVEPSDLAEAESGTGRGLAFSNPEGRVEKLSGDPAVIDRLLTVLQHEIIEAYRQSELSAKNALGITAQSGIAKAYDFRELESLLKGLARWCQDTENWLIREFCLVTGRDPELYATSVYSDSFDVLSAEDRFAQLEKILTLAGIPDEVKKGAMREIVTSLWPMDSPQRAEMLDAIDSQQTSPAERLLGGLSRPGGGIPPVPDRTAPLAGTESVPPRLTAGSGP